jgi:hypothetical protein
MKIVKKTSTLKATPKPKPAAETYSLPTDLSTPSNNLWDFGIMIHAEKKVGKTSLSSMIPDCFFMMTQPGAKSFQLYQRPVPNWEAFKAYIQLLEKDKRFKRVVVDHIDGAYKSCTRFICKREGMDHPSDEGYGKGHALVNDEFDHWMNRLLACGKGVILLTHSALKDIKTRTGTEYTKIMTTLPAGAWGVLEQNIDLWIHLFYEGDKRMMQILGDEHVGAGHNIDGHFLFTNGTPIKTISMGKTKQEAYANLIKAFNNELEAPKEGKNEIKKFTVKKKVK